MHGREPQVIVHVLRELGENSSSVSKREFGIWKKRESSTNEGVRVWICGVEGEGGTAQPGTLSAGYSGY